MKHQEPRFRKFRQRQRHWINVAMEDPREERVKLALSRLSRGGVGDVARGLMALGAAANNHPALSAIRKFLDRGQVRHMRRLGVPV